MSSRQKNRQHVRLSDALFQYLCTIPEIGTNKSVKRRRMMHEAEDELLHKQKLLITKYMIITSGSKGEGFDFKESDLDRLYIIDDANVYQKIEDAENDVSDKQDLLFLESVEAKAGYVKIRVYTCFGDMRKICVEKDGHLYLSSFKLTDSLISLLFPSKKVNGPSISNGDMDDVIALHCKEWIQQAHSWLFRPRQMWPSPTIIANIIEHGVQFVPIGSEGSPNKDIEWRISFNIAEKQFVFTFNHTQFLCYALFKVLLQVIKRRFDIQNRIRSYYLKTVVFWMVEETKQDAWKPNYLLTAYMSCLKRLIFYVQYCELPHYFISDHNLFQNQFDNYGNEEIMTILNVCLNNGLKFLLSSEILSRFSVIFNNPLRVRFTYYERLGHFRLLVLFQNTNTDEPFNRNACYIINKIKRCNCLQKQKMFLRILSGICKTRACILYANSTECNKGSYIRYQRCLSYLLIGTYEDSVSGWLVTAMVFYNMQLYNLSLYIIDYVQSKHLIAANIENSDLLDTLKLNAMSIFFHHKSPLIPTEIFTDENFPISELHSIPFIYFLKFLCHFRLCRFDHCMDTISAIRMFSDGMLHPNVSTPLINTILEITYDMIGLSHKRKRYY